MLEDFSSIHPKERKTGSPIGLGKVTRQFGIETLG